MFVTKPNMTYQQGNEQYKPTQEARITQKVEWSAVTQKATNKEEGCGLFWPGVS